ncbi:ABC transporter permease [Thiohalorhabdus methylotrophus]|uniref:ABC transporter permease n=1 Tax=Thiohalorhabdus methylotrophus TaxID=3242694 RepID=A0ABV4TWG5_9GAMM
MRRVATATMLCGGLCLPQLAGGHEVHHRVLHQEAVVVQLRYADDHPFRHERYTVRRAGAEAPFQRGRTDARGRIVFVPEGKGPWRIKAQSASGHGQVLTVEAGGASAREPAEGSGTGTRWSRMVFAVGLILALFGGFTLFQNRKGKT